MSFLGNRSNEANAALAQRPDDVLPFTVVIHRLACRVDARPEHGVGYYAPLPDRIEKLIARDNPVSVPDQKREQIEHLRLDSTDARVTSQLALARIELEMSEFENHDSSPRPLTHVSLPASYRK